MAYQIKDHTCIPDELRRIGREQVEQAIDELNDPSIDLHATVHQVRKRCKKLRGLLRLPRPGFEELYEKENAFFRDAARLLADLRDRKTMIATYDRLMEHFAEQVSRKAFGSIRRQLTCRLGDLVHDQQECDRRLNEFSHQMRDGLQRVKAWDVGGVHPHDLAGGIKKTYSRGRKAMVDAYAQPAAARFHEWRKRAKYHWYHTRLIESIWPSVFQVYQQELHELSDLLGDAHDLAVLCDAIRQDPDQFGRSTDIEVFQGLADRRRHELHAAAEPLGQRVFADEPKQWARRFTRLWKAWKGN